MRYIAVLAVLVSLLGNTIFAQEDLSQRFVKPMKIKPVVSGSFGELRSNHFHSGLDLTTSQKTGYRIYASDLGHVSRIKVSPYGYGKAIYVDHPSGYTTVYAHMDRYSNRIDSLIQSRQYAKQSFAIELFFKEGELPIERGEVIGYSGNSGGSGGPHLHYEVREKATQKPINPLLFRNDIVDNVKPKIQGMKLYILSEESSIQGRRADKYVPTVFYEGASHPKGSTTFNAFGKIGVGVQVLDYFTDSWRKCGITTIDLYCNDTLVYNFTMKKFSFAESRYINSHIDYAEKRRTGKVIQKSYVEPNNQLSLYGKKQEYTVNVKPSDIKQMKYVIKDYAGNTSLLTFTLKGEEPLDKLESKSKPVVDVKFNEALNLDTLDLRIKIPAKTFYTDIVMLINKSEENALLAPVYEIGNRYIPLHRSMSITIPVPDSLQKYEHKLVLAGVTASGKCYSVGGKYANGKLTTSTRSFGRFTVALDTILPIIKLSKAPANKNYSGRKSLNIIITDDFSGIKKYNCFIDDQWALFEYDAKRKLLIGNFKAIPFLKKGKHKLDVEVTDNRGNKATKTYFFTR